jgi:hypothetical protein
MAKYVAHIGRLRVTSTDKQQLQEILRRDRDRKVRAEQERRERAIRKEIRDFLRRYRTCVFRYGNAEGLLCTFRPREQRIIARWWVDEEFIPPKPDHVERLYIASTTTRRKIHHRRWWRGRFPRHRPRYFAGCDSAYP